MKLQEALDSERQRHDSEEAVPNRQIQELEGEIDTKRQAFEEARSGLSRVKEELRLTKREEHNLNEKIQGLEDEIEILRAVLTTKSIAQGRRLCR
jgi:predicted nuclease with TOPRIM domain